MSEITEVQIKAMSKEQNYLKGYSDGKSDALDELRVEIEQNAYPIVYGVNNHEKGMTLCGVLQIIDNVYGQDFNPKEVHGHD